MPTTRTFLEEHDWPACAYCGDARAVHKEHVVPIAMRRRHHIETSDARFHVPSCARCNYRKSTYRLYPKGFDVSILPGKDWREWHGEPVGLFLDRRSSRKKISVPACKTDATKARQEMTGEQ